jgi:hypothetical protein
MKSKLFNNLLLFSLFGIALGFFGMLYEGIVFVPKMLDNSMTRMLFWKDFYATLNPLAYYIPLVPVATIVLIVLYFTTPIQNAALKSRLKWAAIFQIAALILTFYMVTQINSKLLFSNIEKYAGVIPVKTLLLNIVSVIRAVIAALALVATFKAYVQTVSGKN